VVDKANKAHQGQSQLHAQLGLSFRQYFLKGLKIVYCFGFCTKDQLDGLLCSCMIPNGSTSTTKVNLQVALTQR
jgi:hypothetical protein